MNINDCEISLKNKILIITSRERSLELDDLVDIKLLMEETTGHIYRYGMYKNYLGYYKAFDFEKDKFIYCASMNEKVAVELVEKYKETQDNDTTS